ncbi:MAG: hypothetical protein IPM50_13075 [Acidobacteriota bacterium]|nr:MAG: hypothetical protein IPM50_13075 [Acidobacteriota bacterium]
MMMYALICISLILLGVAGLQFTYLFYVDRLYRERRKYLQDLEYRYARLTARLEYAERRITEQQDIIATLTGEEFVEEDWEDIIEEH